MRAVYVEAADDTPGGCCVHAVIHERGAPVLCIRQLSKTLHSPRPFMLIQRVVPKGLESDPLGRVIYFSLKCFSLTDERVSCVAASVR